MTPRVLHQHLEGRGVHFEVRNGALEIDAPKGLLDDEMVSAVRRNQTSIRLLVHTAATRPCGVAPIPGSVSALELTRTLGWDESRFRSFSRRVIGRPGPASVADDQLIADALLATLQEDWP